MKLMESKLIKVDDNYVLVEPLTPPEEGMLFITKDNVLHTNIGWNYGDGLVIASTNTQHEVDKLSIKNCQAIERGYNLNELGMDYASTIYDGRTELTRFNGAKVDFIKGFQKALELMGDKKFSEDDVRNAYLEGANQALDFNSDSVIDENKYTQSLQQTEWDVEIEMECGEVKQCECSSNENCLNPQPKLDENGCLILKRI